MTNKTFLYKEVYRRLREEILTGRLMPEDRLPSEDEIAQTFSVSRITVKRALALLTEEGLIHRVQGRGTYVSQPAAQQSSRESSAGARPLIGLVLEHVSSAFGLEMMYRIGQHLDEKGYKLCTRFTFGSISKETEEINDLLALNVAGLIIMPCHDSHYNMTILRLILEKFPVVLVDKRMHGLPVHSVCTDGREAMRLLTHHLSQRGCGNASIITVDPASTSSLGDRAEGFYKGLEETGMTCAGECILPRRTNDMISSEPEPDFVRAVGEYLDGLQTLPDGIVCTEYAIGRALYAASIERNLLPGRDFRACCIDENDLATQGFYFTHMRQNENRIAEKTVSILLELMHGDSGGPNDVRIPALFRQGSTT